MKKLFISLSLLTLLGCNTTKEKNEFVGASDLEQVTTYKTSLDPLNDNPKKYPKKGNLTIIGVDNVPQKNLEYAKQVIENYYEYNVTIKEGNVRIKDDYYIDVERSTVDVGKFVTSYEPEEKVLFITDDKLYMSPIYCRGYTTLYGKIIIVRNNRETMKETITHEIGHTCGLEHCGNLTCIMATSNDEYETGKFCQKCENLLINN